MDDAGAVLLGTQEPSYLWVPPYDITYGVEACELAASAGLHLYPWQQLTITHALAEDPNPGVGAAAGAYIPWLNFEVGILVSRQNGKGSILEAVELSWLFLFNQPLIIHSAHLFETSREHFLRLQARIDNHDDFRRRVRRMREGRGAEEIELITGERLKFMTRKGGAGRGFTAGKVVMDEAMYLDSAMMGASLPTMATIPDAQIFYTGSAGMKTSTQLALVRRRGYACDPGMMLAEWAINSDPVEEGGDDRSLSATWARANPSLGYVPGISLDYIRKEGAALGGFDSAEFGRERLGVGEWPEDEEVWEVVSEQAWLDASRPDLLIVEGTRVCFAADTHPGSGTTSVACCARVRGRLVVQLVERRRGTTWLVDWFEAMTAVWSVCAVVMLRSNPAAATIDPLGKRRILVQSPQDTEYAQACGRFATGVEGGTTVHVAQGQVKRAVAGGRKYEGREGGWRWLRSSPVDIAPAVSCTLAAWGLERFADAAVAPWAMSMSDVGAPPTTGDAVMTLSVGAAGFAAARRAQT